MKSNETILIDHGSGGKISNQLVAQMMLPAFDNPILARLDDGATLEIGNQRIAFSTDSFVVDPLFFPGGNIGDLAINGTVNDLAMCGAVPQYLSMGLIIEEGFSTQKLQTIIDSMGRAAKTAGVILVTGDTKVVPAGAADKLFINTAGIGQVAAHIHIGSAHARPGDCILVSGTIGDHGMTILAQREELGFSADIQSDSAPLCHMSQALLKACPQVHVLRDPTRGGVATALNEIAQKSGVGIQIEASQVPVLPPVSALCDLLGLDPLHVANEGKMLVFVAPEEADLALHTLRSDPLGTQAAIIGQVVDDHAGRVYLKTPIGGSRLLDMLTGEQLPRIC